MPNLTVFENPAFGQVRTLTIGSEPWFVGKDVATVLGYKNPQEAIRAHVDDDDKGVSEILTPGGKQNITIINESGLYSLILSSKLPNAKEFKHWVTSEVLPSIRKHGAYMTPETIEQVLSNPDTIIRLATQLKEEQNRNRQLTAEVSALTVDKSVMQPKADYFDELVDRNLLTSFRETAKLLGVKQKKFITFLLEHKCLYRDQKGALQAYAKHKTDGLFENKESFNEKTQWKGTQTMVTPKGRETFRLLCQGL